MDMLCNTNRLVVRVVACSRLVVESINDCVSVDLGICNPGVIGNNDLVVAVQR